MPHRPGMAGSGLDFIADAAARQRALDPRESFIVQAPAGSGKTELLTRRTLVLLAQAAHPEEVVAITFTRKAANEMRERVLAALDAARSAPCPEGAHQANRWNLARTVIERDIALGWQLSTNPSRLRIHTIDSFCASLTRQMPYLSRFGAPPAATEDAERLLREAARNTLAHLEEQGPWSAAVERLLRHLDNNHPKAVELIAQMLARRDQWLRHLADGRDHAGRRARLEAALAAINHDALARLVKLAPAALSAEVAALVRYASSQLGGQPDHPVHACATLAAWPGGVLEQRVDWQGLAALLLTDKGEWRKAVNVRTGFPAKEKSGNKAENDRREEMKQRMTALLDSLREHEALRAALAELPLLPPPRYDEASWEVVEALCEVLMLAVAELKLEFTRRGEADFTEIAQGALRALGTGDAPTDLALHLDYRIRHLLVDEFQDTSVSQYELLQLLTAGWQAGDGRTLFVVGDPMQSIYRFRQAEVGLYLRARHEGIGGVRLTPLTLTVNFRSQQGVVDWVNTSFAQVLPAEENIAAGAVPYAAAVAHHPAEPGLAVHTHAFLDTGPDAEAQRVVELVTAARARYPEGRIAILVRSRAPLARIAPRLKLAGHAFRAVEIEPLADRPVVQDLLALTRALTHLADRAAWLAVLRAPWCGLTLADLVALAGDDDGGSVWALVQDEARAARLSDDGRARLARTRAVLSDAIKARGRSRLRQIVEGAWLALGGPACVDAPTDLEDARIYLDLLDELEEGGDIADAARLAEQVSELYALPDVSASDAVQLMTIHKAKGLEFDTVILPGLGDRPRRDDPPLLRWMETPHGGDAQGRASVAGGTTPGMEEVEQRREQLPKMPGATGAGHPADLLLAPIRETGGEHDLLYNYLARLDKDKSRYEAGRLLYVAATRAKRTLHLLGTVKVDDDGTAKNPPADSLLALLWPVVRDEFTVEHAGTAPPEPPVATAHEPGNLRRLITAWQAPPLPASAVWEAGAALPVPDAMPEVEFDWASETIRHVGTVVHQTLQRIGREGLARWPMARIDALAPGVHVALARRGVPETKLDDAVARVREALQRTVSDTRGAWLFDAAHQDARSEYALTLPERGRVVTAVIDRTFVDANGVRWIIDYKTSTHEGSGREEFLDREQERYRAQLERYARVLAKLDPRPIRLGLYFPLLGGWREWSGGQ